MKFHVPDMSCGHCTRAIETAIGQSDAGARTTCDLASHTVSVESQLSAEEIAAVLTAAGYDSIAMPG
ncbi:MAG: heavy-metal-associated domain-containing protein [Paracoccaceae bacterium]